MVVKSLQNLLIKPYKWPQFCYFFVERNATVLRRRSPLLARFLSVLGVSLARHDPFPAYLVDFRKKIVNFVRVERPFKQCTYYAKCALYHKKRICGRPLARLSDDGSLLASPDLLSYYMGENTMDDRTGNEG